MHKSTFVLLGRLWSLFLCLSADAQSCCSEHIEAMFPTASLQVVEYTEGLSRFDGTEVNGVARVWTANGDTCSRKPLLILLHGGGFTAGFPDLMDPLAQQFARRGYVAASISYRLGWIGGSTCPVDSAETYRAWYRAVQDGLTAVRFFRSQAEIWNIDTSLVFVAGWSAGGYAAVGMAYTDQISEKPEVCGPLNAIDFNGNLFARADLGEPFSGAYPNQSNAIKAVSTLAASVFLPQNLSNGAKPPLLALNNEADPYLIPYNNCSVWWNFDNCAVFPNACGTGALSSEFIDAGIEAEQVTYNTTVCGHNLHDPCFPFFEDLVNRMAIFFNHQMDCPLVLANPMPLLKKPALQWTARPGEGLPKVESSYQIINMLGSSFSSGIAPEVPGNYFCISNQEVWRLMVVAP